MSNEEMHALFRPGDCVFAVETLIFPPVRAGDIGCEISAGTVGEVVQIRDPRRYMYPYVIRFDRGGPLSLTEDQVQRSVALGSLVVDRMAEEPCHATTDRPHRNCWAAHAVNVGAMVGAYISLCWFQPLLSTVLALPLFALGVLVYRRHGGEGSDDLPDGSTLRVDPVKAAVALRWDVIFGSTVLLLALTISACMTPVIARTVGVPVMSPLIFFAMILTLVVYGVKTARHRSATVIVQREESL